MSDQLTDQDHDRIGLFQRSLQLSRMSHQILRRVFNQMSLVQSARVHA